MNEMTDTVGPPIFNIPQDGAPVAGEITAEAFDAALSARIFMLTVEAFAAQRPALIARVEENILDVTCLTLDSMAQTFRFAISPGPLEEIEKEIMISILEIVMENDAVTDMIINQVLCGFGPPSLLLE
jgi:hypothetical protein